MLLASSARTCFPIRNNRRERRRNKMSCKKMAAASCTWRHASWSFNHTNTLFKHMQLQTTSSLLNFFMAVSITEWARKNSGLIPAVLHTSAQKIYTTTLKKKQLTTELETKQNGWNSCRRKWLVSQSTYYPVDMCIDKSWYRKMTCLFWKHTTYSVS